MKWKEILFYLALLTIIILTLKYINNYYDSKEGFSQCSSFSLKTNNDIYDEFYVNIYDTLHKTSNNTEYEYYSILKTTQPDENSVILDIGSGTGNLLNKFDENGYNAHGLEKSKDMIEYCKNKNKLLSIRQGDATDPMTFDKGTFTHICCLDFTIYHIKDKKIFFRNCYNWLLPNGYLILHLVNKEKYDTSVKSANPFLNDNPQNYSKKRILNTNINFIDFNYLNNTEFKNDNKVVIKETFTNSHNKVRQNELTLYMEDLDEILKISQNIGFIAHSKITYPIDKEQFIYILEKQL